MWIIPALISAISQSTVDYLGKRGLQKREEYIVAFYLVFLALPFASVLLIFVGIPTIGKKFLFALIMGGSLNTIATILYMKAIKASPLSMTVPMLAFSPIFMLFTSPLILDEMPTIGGIFGIILITSGAYTLNFDRINRSLFHPFHLMKREKGVPLMLLVAFIYSFAADFDKLGTTSSNFAFWVFSLDLFLSIMLGTIVLIKVRGNLKNIKNDIKSLSPMGLSEAVSQLSGVAAMPLTFAPYVIAIRRTSIMFSSIFGFVMFKEKNFVGRMISISIILIGIFVLTFSQLSK